MSISGRVQLLLGVVAAFAAYLLLLVYNDGDTDFSHILQRMKDRPVAAPAPSPASAAHKP